MEEIQSTSLEFDQTEVAFGDLPDCDCNSGSDPVGTADVLAVDIDEELVADTTEELLIDMAAELETKPEQLEDKAWQGIVQFLYMGMESKALGPEPYVVLSLFERRWHFPHIHSFYTH